MRIDLTDLSPVKKSMVIEVDAEEVDRETREVVREFVRKSRIPGFRAGKAPASVVRKRFAREIRDDVRERVLSRCYHEAAREKGLRPIGAPVLDEVKHEDNAPLSFKTTFEILPEFEPKGYRGIEVRRPSAKIDELDVDRTLEEIRQSRVQLVATEDHKAVTGDVIVADVEGVPEGGEPFRRERMMVEIGATENLPAFNEPLEGLIPGDEPAFSVDYPENYPAEELAGRSVAYKLHVHEVKRKVLPELDDDFAKDLGEFEDLAALRVRLHEDLGARKKQSAEQTVRQSILDKVLVENPVVLPDGLVDEEIRDRLEEIVRNLMRQGMDPEKAELDWKEIRKQQEEPARKSVHARLILDAVGKAEAITVGPEEIEARIRRDARALGEKPEALRATLRKHHRIEALENQLVREKSLDLLASVANIQDEE